MGQTVFSHLSQSGAAALGEQRGRKLGRSECERCRWVSPWPPSLQFVTRSRAQGALGACFFLLELRTL